MESLNDIFNRIGHFGGDAGHNDKGSTHSYIETYERLFAPFRQSGSLLEIGLASGKSLDLWAEYFGPKAKITGADISIAFDVSRFDGRVRVVEADATSPAILASLGAETFDIIIDDGSHMEADQAAAFLLLSPRVRPGGLYIIEDILSPEQSVPHLLSLHATGEFIDLRGVKGRFDDGLIVFRF